MNEIKEIRMGIKDMSNFENTTNATKYTKIVRETEKAVAYEYTTVDWQGFDVKKLQWIPKSIIKDGIVPFWFIEKNFS